MIVLKNQVYLLTYEEVYLPSNWQEITSAEDYEKAIAQIHHHLRQGDTYQVNYTVQLKQELSAILLLSTIVWWWSRKRDIMLT